MHKIVKSSVRAVKKEVKSFLLKPKPSLHSTNRGKDNPSLFNRGKEFVVDILKFKTKRPSKESSMEFIKKNKSFFSKSNLKALLAYIFSDFSMDQIEDMIRYIFGNLSEEQRDNVLLDIIEHINEKEYGFLLKD